MSNVMNRGRRVADRRTNGANNMYGHGAAASVAFRQHRVQPDLEFHPAPPSCAPVDCVGSVKARRCLHYFKRDLDHNSDDIGLAVMQRSRKIGEQVSATRCVTNTDLA